MTALFLITHSLFSFTKMPFSMHPIKALDYHLKKMDGQIIGRILFYLTTIFIAIPMKY
jgi:hypothetical protein